MLKAYVATITEYSSAEYNSLCSALPFGKNEAERLLAVNNSVYRTQSLCALLTLQKLLLRCNIAPRHIRRTQSGKPYFEGSSAIPFSISHSGSLVAVVLGDTDDISVGIDIETVAQDRAFTRLATRFFTVDEQKAFEKYGADMSAFLRIWTQKEAKAKYIGGGLSSLLAHDDISDNLHYSTQTLCVGSTEAVVSICHAGKDRHLQIFTDEE